MTIKWNLNLRNPYQLVIEVSDGLAAPVVHEELSWVEGGVVRPGKTSRSSTHHAAVRRWRSRDVLAEEATPKLLASATTVFRIRQLSGFGRNGFSGSHRNFFSGFRFDLGRPTSMGLARTFLGFSRIREDCDRNRFDGSPLDHGPVSRSRHTGLASAPSFWLRCGIGHAANKKNRIEIGILKTK